MALDIQPAMSSISSLAGTLSAAGTISTVDGRGLPLRTGKGRLTLSGTFTATTFVRLQCRDNEDDVTTGWVDVEDPVTHLSYFTTSGVRAFDFKGKVFVRVKINAGEFTGGDSIVVRVSDCV